MKYIILLFILAASIIIFSSIGGKEVSIYKPPTPTPTLTPTSTPTPSFKLENLDDSIEYQIPTGWKKEIINRGPDNTTNSITLASPDYRYNSLDGPDNGVKIFINRRTYTAKIPLKDKLLKDGNPYAGADFKVIPTMIDGQEAAFSSPHGDGLGFDLNFPHLNIVKDGYLYFFFFSVENDSGYKEEINNFIKSIKFK